MQNRVRIRRLDRTLVISASHGHHGPVQVHNESEIFPELQEIVKYFFPQPFEFNYSESELCRETIEGLKAYEEIYDFGIGKYNRQRVLFSRQIGKLEEEINKVKSSFEER